MKTNWLPITIVAVLLLFLCIFLSSAAQRPTRSDEAELTIRNLEQRWLENEDNPDTLATILADDFVHALPMGFLSKKDQLDYLRKHLRPFRGTKRFDELRVRIYGSTAIANGIVTETPEGSSSTRKTVFTDVFVKRHGEWQAVNAQEVPWHQMDSR